MKSLAYWSARSPVAANVLMALILIMGFFSVVRMRREFFPEFTLDMISISVPYPGASPEEVERGICQKIEEQIDTVTGVKRITSTAAENVGSVLVELETGADPSRVYDDVRNGVDRIFTFPLEAEEPTIQVLTQRQPAIYLVLFADLDEHAMRSLAEEVRDELLLLPDVSQVFLGGTRDYEISIEVNETILRRYGLTLDSVARKVRDYSLDLPAGRLKTDQGDIVVRAKGQRYRGVEYKEIPLITTPEGASVRLGDVAKVIDGFADEDIFIRCQGKNAVLVQVMKTDKQDVIHVVDAVKTYVSEKRPSLPKGVQMILTNDQSRLVQSRIDLLVKNGLQGLILVFLALWLFLRFRLAFWVAVGIPISFMGGFFILKSVDATINMLSLFSFIMALGIVVDDAIIVGENIYASYTRGRSPLEAAVEGAGQVGWPVTISVLTTMVAFAPLFFVSGMMGKFIAIIPVAVVAILAVSLLEAFLILPAHIGHSLEGAEKRKQGIGHGWRHHMIEFILNRIYEPWFIRPAVRFRYVTAALALAATVFALASVASGHLKFVFFPKVEGDDASVEIAFPQGTPVAVTTKAVAQLEDALLRVAEKLDSKLTDVKDDSTTTILRSVLSYVGSASRQGAQASDRGSHMGQVVVELLPSEEREQITSEDVLQLWRREVGDIPGIEQIKFTGTRAGPGGAALEVRLLGDNIDRVQQAAEELKEQMKSYTGVFDVRDDFATGKWEMKIRAKPEADNLGLTLGEIARQVRHAFYGAEALRLQRGRFDIKVMVRYPEEERRNRSTIERMRIRTPRGGEVPFTKVADVDFGRGYSTIKRVDRRRAITITADVDEAVSNASEIMADLTRQSESDASAPTLTTSAGFLQNLIQRYPGVTYDLEGQARERVESIQSLMIGFLYALVAIYCLLAAEFRSYFQPVIIMCAIPVALTGAFAGHVLMGQPITMLSFFGIVALSGIVVNDSLILIDFINHRAAGGMEAFAAVIDGARSRLRAIILTSMTTVAGLIPLLFERSFQAQFLKPMAISIAFGLVASTALTLLVTPSLYMIIADIKGLFGLEASKAQVEIDLSQLDFQVEEESM